VRVSLSGRRNELQHIDDTSISTGPRVSVVIPTKNEEEVICDCLFSVFDQSFIPFEVIVVDGLSTDDTLKKAREFPVRILIEKEPTSLPNARNLGVQKATGEIVFIIDADVVLEKKCVENAVKYFQDPNVVAVIPSIRDRIDTRLEKIQVNWLKGTSNPFRSGIGIPIFAELLRKEIFNEIEFDPNLGYGEDDDFQQRLKQLSKSSGKIVHAYDSKISVHYPHTFKELWSQCTWWGRTSIRYFIKKLRVKTVLNLGSVLGPTIVLVLSVLVLVLAWAIPFLVLASAFLVARNLIACYRSKSRDFFEFIGFEFVRSLFFVIGIVQGFFLKQRGR